MHHEPKEKVTIVLFWIKKGTSLFIVPSPHRFNFTFNVNSFHKEEKNK